MDGKSIAILILIIIGVLWFIWSALVSGSKADDAIEEQQRLKIKGDKNLNVDVNLRAINTYFFENNMFSFEKFCDYILCIKDTMSLNELAQSVMELDLLLRCSGDLNDKIISILTYSEAIIGINYQDFPKMQQDIRDGVFKGTYQDLVFIYVTALFYLKYLIAVKKGKFDSYNK